MEVKTLITGIIITWIASVLAFPSLSLQQWINSRLRSLWKFITFQPIGLTGRWMAVYSMPRSVGDPEQRIEFVKCNQLSGGEVRGNIRDMDTQHRYKFQGRFIFDKFVGYYWSADQSKDVGNFKFDIKEGYFVLEGILIVYDTRTGETRAGINYDWYRLNNRLITKMKNVRVDISQIDGAGLFSKVYFETGQKIGKIKFGPVANQGKYTLKFNGKNRIVKKPWRYLNHACEPNAHLEWSPDQVILVASKEILPQNEVTIDYRSLPETITEDFECRCPKCSSFNNV